MKQCKALLRKEWRINRKQFLLPLWFTLCVYGAGLIGWIVSLIMGTGIVQTIQAGSVDLGFKDFFLFGVSRGTVALIGFIALITALSLADQVINGDYKHRCEILHFSQPLTFAKIILTKYLFIILGTILLFGLIAMVNSVLISLVSGHLVGAQIYYGLVGALQVWLKTSLSIVFLGSLAWFFAGLFKKNSFFMGVMVLLGIQALILILNYLAGWQIPSPVGYIMKLATVNININIDPQLPRPNLPDIDSVVGMGWKGILNWNSLLKLAYSALLFVGGSYLYKRRELS